MFKKLKTSEKISENDIQNTIENEAIQSENFHYSHKEYLDKKNLVSIIIPCYNQAQYLEETVQSVVEQTYTNIEIIIINDGSPDNTEEVTSALQQKYPNIRVLTQANSGVSIARNNGINIAKGEYIVSLDADDILNKEMIAQCMKIVQTNDADVVYFDLQCFGSSNRTIIRKPFSENNILYENLPVPMSLYKKQVWQRVNGYKQNMDVGYEDWEFWINVYKHGFQFHYHPGVMALYRVKKMSRDTDAIKKDTYLKAKIVINHPELYTSMQVVQAIRTIKETEFLPKLYFYSCEGVIINDELFSSKLDDYLRTQNLLDEQTFEFIGNTKIKLYALEQFENEERLREFMLTQDDKSILFYTSLRYVVPSLQCLSITWDYAYGFIPLKGTVFDYTFRSKKEDANAKILAYQRLENFQEVIRMRRVDLTISSKNIQHESDEAVNNKKYEGHYSYTIITSFYNVEEYVDDYFRSVINQSHNFERHIHLVLVDDGSPDNSAEIIFKWQKRFPNNITYVKKKNGGLSSARNAGLSYVKTPWVTFIDPDDYIDQDYFLEIDKFLYENRRNNIKMLGCKLIRFYEKTGVYNDTHPLNHKFKNGNKVVQIKNQNHDIQLSSATSLYLIEEINKHHLRFDEELKPSFEDARFNAEYLLPHQDCNIGFVALSKYYYRKRADSSSMLDTSWEKLDAYDLALRKGPLEIFYLYQERLGSIPKSIQNMVLYHVFWQIKVIVNNPESLSFLDDAQKSRYLELMEEIFSYIDEKTILDFKLAGFWFYHRVGVLGAFKNQSPSYQICYIDKFDTHKRQIRLKYFTHQESLESIQLDGQELIPDFIKIVKHDLLDRVFTYEYILWIHIPVLSDKELKVYINNQLARITFNRKPYKKINISQLNTFLLPVSVGVDSLYEKCWILMDRDIQADDNAEHLYRYIAKKHPEQKIYFALRNTSHDWERLSQEGFNLLDFGSIEYEDALNACGKIISSHIDEYIVHYFGADTLKNKHFVFLQHGTIQSDLSHWLNRKTIDLFITATKPEYESIAGDNNRYLFTQKEVMLTGVPRHDTLLRNNRYDGKIILIMPTWRKYIIGSVVDNSNEREINPDFMETAYARRWNSLLHSDTLNTLSKQYGYRVVYFPHTNIQPYLPMLSIPEYIEVLSHQDKTIQKLFQEASLMITDYSSVAFEMGILGKSVIYYQFDENDFFKDHGFQKGYFDYQTHGFGPVVEEETELFSHLETILLNQGQPIEPYKTRIENTFAFRDYDNCKRTYDAIRELDEPYNEDKRDMDLALTYANKAYEAQEWKLAKQRFDYIQLATKGRTKEVNDKFKTASLENYCLDMLKRNELLLIDNVQNTVLDALGWYIKEIVDKPEKVELLTSEQKNHYLELLDEIFSYIDKAFILKYDPSKLWFFYKVGILSCFKNEKPDYQIAYVHEMNTTKQQICLRYFTHKEEIASIQIDGADVVPAYTKTIQHDFMDRVFVYEQRIWIHIPVSAKSLKVFVDGMHAPIFFQGKQHKELGAAEFYESIRNKDLLFSRYLQKTKKISKKMIRNFFKKIKNIVKKRDSIV